MRVRNKRHLQTFAIKKPFFVSDKYGVTGKRGGDIPILTFLFGIVDFWSDARKRPMLIPATIMTMIANIPICLRLDIDANSFFFYLLSEVGKSVIAVIFITRSFLLSNVLNRQEWKQFKYSFSCHISL